MRLTPAQERGEVRTRSDNQLPRSSGKLSPDDIAPTQRIAEWRDVRDAGEEVVESALQKAISKGRAPTKSEILQAAREINSERQAEKKERRAQRERELGARQAALPDKRYGVILGDPASHNSVWSEEIGARRFRRRAESTDLRREVPKFGRFEFTVVVSGTGPTPPTIRTESMLPLDPDVADLAPSEPTLTPYDREHAATYMRLLDADAEGSDWRELARIVLRLDPEVEPDRARQAFDSHLARAKWTARHGYRHLLQRG